MKNLTLQVVVQTFAIILAISQTGCGDEAKIAELREKYGGKSKRISMIYNGKDLQRFNDILPYGPQIPELKHAVCIGRNTTRHMIEAISKIVQLEEFESRETTLTSADYESLGNLTNIKELSLKRLPKIDDEIFAIIAKMPKLEVLELNYNNLDGSKFHLIANNPNIIKLRVNGNNMDDKIVASLLKMPQLQELIITDTKITPEGQAQLMSLVNLTRYAAPDISKEKGKELALLAIAARQKARAAGLTTGPDNLAPYYSHIQER